MWNSITRSVLGIFIAVGAMLGTGCVAGSRSAVGQGTAGRVAVGDGITIAYQSFGASDAEVILLIAGGNAQLTLWPDELVDELVRRGYRVIRFDNRDSGLSTHLDALGLPDWEGTSHGRGRRRATAT